MVQRIRHGIGQTMAVLLALAPLNTQAEAPVRVEMLRVEEMPLIETASLTGTIEPVEAIALGFPAGGRVIDVQVKTGDRVVAGQIIARTDPLQQDQALRVAEAALESAVAARDQAQAAERRARAMLDRGVGTRAATDQARQALSQAEGGVRQAVTGVEQARRALQDTTLRAPVTGIVTKRDVEPGQIVGPAQPVVMIAGLHGREAVFQVADTPRVDAALGARVALHAMDVAAPDMTGHVSEVSPLVDPRSGTVQIRVAIDNAPNDTQLLGAAVRGTIRYPGGQGIRLPWTALTRHGGAPAVWIVDAQGQARLQPITIARFTNGFLIVAEGLDPGMTVVGEGSQLLFPGRAVVDARGSR